MRAAEVVRAFARVALFYGLALLWWSVWEGCPMVVLAAR